MLLLEDLPEGRGTPEDGCDARTAERALRPLAALHAHFWESPRLSELAWLKPLDETPKLLHVLFRRAWPGFRASGRARSARLDLRALGAWLDEHGVALLRALGAAPVTLIHGDYHLDNLVFAHGELRAALDWQAVARARGVFDAAYWSSAGSCAATISRCWSGGYPGTTSRRAGATTSSRSSRCFTGWSSRSMPWS
jgi:hypothetical protein